LRKAATAFRQGLALYAKLAAEFPEESIYRHGQSGVLNHLGRALRSLPGEAAAALRCHEQALDLATRFVAECPEQPHYRNELVRSHFGWGITVLRAERPADAVQAFAKALDAARPPPGTPDSAVNWSQVASVHNEWAWLLANYADVKLRDPKRAVALAQRAVELAPDDAGFWNTLGTAHYRAGDPKAALAALQQSMDRSRGGDSFDWFFAAMAHWQLGNKEAAVHSYQRATTWMGQHRAGDAELRRFRAEATQLLGVITKKDSSPR
jgi:tetratricopeptide (TPR) repeat protein